VPRLVTKQPTQKAFHRDKRFAMIKFKMTPLRDGLERRDFLPFFREMLDVELPRHGAPHGLAVVSGMSCRKGDLQQRPRLVCPGRSRSRRTARVVAASGESYLRSVSQPRPLG